MKKFICAVLMLIAAFSFAGCGNNNGNTGGIGKIESYDYILLDNPSISSTGFVVFCLEESAYIDDIDVCFINLNNGRIDSINCGFYTDWSDYRLLNEYYPKGTRFFVIFGFNRYLSSDYCIKVSGRKITDGKVAEETTVIYTEEFSFNF